MDINELLRQSESLSETLQKQFKETKSFGRNEDTRFWKCTQDQNGNGYAVIRFLPNPPSDKYPKGIEPSAFVRMYSYGFQGPTGAWYIEKSRRTIDEEDPVNDYNRRLYAQKTDAAKEKARKTSQRTRFVSNILVIEDPAKPENNGKVFLFEYGKKIYEMINDKLFPQFPDEPKINVYDFLKGANFKLKIRKHEGFPNYDRCEFSPPSALLDGDPQKLGAIWKQCYSLQDFLDPSQFKSYEELEVKFNQVMGLAPSDSRRGVYSRADVKEESEAPWEPAAAKAPEPGPSIEAEPMPTASADADDDLAFFQSLRKK